MKANEFSISLVCPHCGGKWTFDFAFRGFYAYTGSKYVAGQSLICGQCTVMLSIGYLLRWDWV